MAFETKWLAGVWLALSGVAQAQEGVASPAQHGQQEAAMASERRLDDSILVATPPGLATAAGSAPLSHPAPAPSSGEASVPTPALVDGRAGESAELGPQQSPADSEWSSKALLIERRSAGRWAPWGVVPLRVGQAPTPVASERTEPAFTVWHEGDARRVEMACAGTMWAWERLLPGASAQLEFGCGQVRYRVQVGMVPELRAPERKESRL